MTDAKTEELDPTPEEVVARGLVAALVHQAEAFATAAGFLP
jgi:hypothetical protein